MLKRIIATAGFLLLLTFGVVAQEVYTDNIVIVLDCSGSMDDGMRGFRGNRLEAAKAAIKEVLKSTPTEKQVGLLAFSGRNKRNDWVFPLGPRNDAVLLNALAPIRPGGSTPLSAYIKVGGDVLLKTRTKQYGYGSYRLLAVTDGAADNRARTQQYAQDIISRGIFLDVIGVEMGDRHELAKIAHSYKSANDQKALQEAVKEVFAEVDGSTDTGGENVFELVAPLPDGFATSVIDSFKSSGNHPIGTKAPQPQVQAPAAPHVNNSQPAPVPTVPAPAAQSEGMSGLAKVLIGLAVVVVVIILGSACRS